MNEFLSTILDGINSVIGNYGWSIMVFTILVRLVLLPLEAKSRKSMRRMSQVQPQLTAIQKKYANDKEKLNQKTAEIYKKEKINPLSSCLPMLLTMPILFAMFGAMRLIANTELATQLFDFISGRQPQYEAWLWIKNIWMADSPFAAVAPDIASINMITRDVWAQAFEKLGDLQAALPALVDAAGNAIPYDFMTDASMKATVAAMVQNMQQVPAYMEAIKTVPGFTNINVILFNISVFAQNNGYFILPLLAAGTQILMTKLNPAATGAQATPAAQGGKGNPASFMTWFFPIFSIFICAGQNAGFSLYWVTANIVVSAQTFILNKYFDAQEKRVVAVGEGTVK